MSRLTLTLCLSAGLASLLSLTPVFAEQASEPPPPGVSKLVSPTGPIMGKSLEEIHQVMELLGKDKKVPDYSAQALNPAGGTIVLPKGWLLYEQHNPRSYTWLATMAPSQAESRGDARMRISLQPNVLKTEKRKPSILTASQVAELVKMHPEVKACQPTTVGPFTKVCYDFEQELAPGTPFHVHASFYYSDALDMFGATLFSAVAAQWEQHAATMDKMDAGLQFFDMKKYGTQAAPAKDAAPAKK